jgi:cysteinyl-tRNA synthetase
VNYWIHNGFVRVDDEKMSKSLGNFFTIRTVLEKYDAEVVRFFILRAHYRSPLNYSDKHLDDAKLALTRLYTALRGYAVIDAKINWQHPQAIRFKEAMDDDFNTPEAMAVLFDLANEVNKGKSLEVASLLKNLAGVLGLLKRDSDVFLQGELIVSISGNQVHNQANFNLDKHDLTGQLVGTGSTMLGSITASKENIEGFIRDRNEAKKAKNFAEADRIRKELADAGIILEDSAQGTTWRKA